MKNSQRMNITKHASLISKIFPSLGVRLSKLVFLLFSIATILFFLDYNHLRKDCNSSNKKNIDACVWSDITTQFYASFFTAALSIVGIEIVLRDETIKQIEEIFNLSQDVKSVEAFYYDKEDYHHLIENKINNLNPGETIKMLLLSDEIAILNSIGENKIKSKLRSGCNFQILVINPDSNSLNHIEKICKTFDEKMVLSSTENQIFTGSLEIRFNENLFSSFGYFSVEEMKIVWLYFSDPNGFQYPAFRFSKTNQKLVNASDTHFENIWNKTSNQDSQIIFRVNRNHTKPFHSKWEPRVENTSQE